jgi:hypothetical protein
MGQGNRVNDQKFNAKAPGRPRTAKTLCLHSHRGTLLVTINHPNRQFVFNSASWRFFFASSRLGVAALVIHPIALFHGRPAVLILALSGSFRPCPGDRK